MSEIFSGRDLGRENGAGRREGEEARYIIHVIHEFDACFSYS